MYSQINDSHGFIRAPALSDQFASVVPFVTREVQGHLTIVAVDPVLATRDGYAKGDVIESVDGTRVEVRYDQLRPYIAASTEQAAQFQLGLNVPGAPAILSGPKGSIAALELRGTSGVLRRVQVPRGSVIGRLFLRTRPPIDVLPGNVGYVDLGRIRRDDLSTAFMATAGTRALIFDLRGYPQLDFTSLASHLATRRVRTALFRNPVRFSPPVTYADFQDENRSFFQLVDPVAPTYQNPVIVLIDAAAISRAEHTCLFLEAAAHAFFVGQPTEGADGDVVTFFVPGAIELHFSGSEVRHADGRPLQRVGIQPNLTVVPTLAGVRSGRDEILLEGLATALRLSGASSPTAKEALRDENRLEHLDRGVPSASP